MILPEFFAAADAQNVVVSDVGLAGGAGKLASLRPLDLDRGDGKEQRAGKIALAADRRLRDGLFDDDIGEPF